MGNSYKSAVSFGDVLFEKQSENRPHFSLKKTALYY